MKHKILVEQLRENLVVSAEQQSEWLQSLKIEKEVR